MASSTAPSFVSTTTAFFSGPRERLGTAPSGHATLAGHVIIEDHATVGAFSGVHQFCRVGTYGYVGGYSVITKDVLPYSKTVSERNAKAYGPNVIGLERKGFSAEQIQNVKAAFRLLL